MPLKDISAEDLLVIMKALKGNDITRLKVHIDKNSKKQEIKYSEE